MFELASLTYFLMIKLSAILQFCSLFVLVNCENQIDIDDYEKHSYASAFMDPRMEDDHEDHDLTDIIRLARAPDRCYGKGCEDLDKDEFTDEQRQAMVEQHNIHKSNMTGHIPKGANMKFMEYNRTLEWAAKLWLQECRFDHGNDKADNMSSVSGQNMYTGPNWGVRNPINLWHNENLDYFFENDTCTKHPKSTNCGHFITMVWGFTQVVGCAIRSNCYPRRQRWRVLFCCHYHPRGFRHDDFKLPIYSFGTPCTRCELGDGNLCHQNLCVDKRMIQTYNLDYTCELDCLNCGAPNQEECRCDCKPGWDRNDCSEPCINRGYWPFNPKWAGSCAYNTKRNSMLNCDKHDLTQFQCRKQCGFCQGIEKEKNYTKDEVCCDGKECDVYSVLDTDTCECRLNCPTMGCLYNETWRAKAKDLGSTSPPSNDTTDRTSGASSETDSEISLLIKLMTCVVIVILL